MFEIRPLIREEVPYVFLNSHEISMKTGLIGHLRAGIGKFTREFWHAWCSFREELNTPEFKDILWSIIYNLRAEGGFLYSRSMLERYCDDGNAYPIYDNADLFGVRVDLENYAFLLGLHLYSGEQDYDVYCFCYVKEWLDKHIENAKRGISIRNKPFEELCRLYDGDYIAIVDNADADNYDIDHTERYEVRYINDSHFEYGRNLRHVDEFADILRRTERFVVPLRASLPDRCYVFVDTDPFIGIVKKGEKGFYRTEITAPTRSERKELVDELNKKLGVTKAQAQAMKAGSMFGWHCPGADPRNYDSDGHLIHNNQKS